MRRKQYVSIAKPTVVVHVHEGAQYNWPTVASFLATFTKSAGIDFESRPASIGTKALPEHSYTDIEKHCPSKPLKWSGHRGSEWKLIRKLRGSIVLRLLQESEEGSILATLSSNRSQPCFSEISSVHIDKRPYL